MLDEKDLQAIQAMLKPIQDNLRTLNLEIENTVKPQLQALAEGQKTIL